MTHAPNLKTIFDYFTVNDGSPDKDCYNKALIRAVILKS
jgi:hypothetical protein